MAAGGGYSSATRDVAAARFGPFRLIWVKKKKLTPGYPLPRAPISVGFYRALQVYTVYSRYFNLRLYRPLVLLHAHGKRQL